MARARARACRPASKVWPHLSVHRALVHLRSRPRQFPLAPPLLHENVPLLVWRAQRCRGSRAAAAGSRHVAYCILPVSCCLPPCAYLLAACQARCTSRDARLFSMLQGGSGGPQAFYGCQCVNGQPLSLPIGMPASAQSGMPFDPIQMMQAAMGMLMQAGIPGQVSRSPTSAPGRAQSPTSASVRCRVVGLHSRLPFAAGRFRRAVATCRCNLACR